MSFFLIHLSLCSWDWGKRSTKEWLDLISALQYLMCAEVRQRPTEGWSHRGLQVINPQVNGADVQRGIQKALEKPGRDSSKKRSKKELGPGAMRSKWKHTIHGSCTWNWELLTHTPARGPHQCKKIVWRLLQCSCKGQWWQKPICPESLLKLQHNSN